MTTQTAAGPAAPPARGRRPSAAMFVTIVVLTNVFGNFFMSLGLKQRGGAELSGLDHIRVLFHPMVAFGVALLIAWMLSRMLFLRWADLSYVLPVTSVGYVLNAILGRHFLGETITGWRWAGTLLIVAGAALAGRTEMRAGGEKR